MYWHTARKRSNAAAPASRGGTRRLKLLKQNWSKKSHDISKHKSSHRFQAGKIATFFTKPCVQAYINTFLEYSCIEFEINCLNNMMDLNGNSLTKSAFGHLKSNLD